MKINETPINNKETKNSRLDTPNIKEIDYHKTYKLGDYPATKNPSERRGWEIIAQLLTITGENDHIHHVGSKHPVKDHTRTNHIKHYILGYGPTNRPIEMRSAPIRWQLPPHIHTKRYGYVCTLKASHGAL